MSAEGELSLKSLNDKLLLECLTRIRWRLKSSASRRLLIDIAALCTGLRNVVMVDYAWDPSGLQNQLSTLLNLLAQEVKIIYCLKIMCIMDAVYIVHLKNLRNYMNATLKQTVNVEFIVLDDILPRFATTIEKLEILKHFSNLQEYLIPRLFHADTSRGSLTDLAQALHGDISVCNVDQSPTIGCINLGDISAVNEAPLPTINGWILGYPVIYLFRKENISKAAHSLSLSSLCRYALSAESDSDFLIYQAMKGNVEKELHELLSFTLPNELNSPEVSEELVTAFFSSIQEKVNVSNIWKSLTLDVTSHICQSVAL